jgi:hypothetical protein
MIVAVTVIGLLALFWFAAPPGVVTPRND